MTGPLPHDPLTGLLEAWLDLVDPRAATPKEERLARLVLARDPGSGKISIPEGRSPDAALLELRAVEAEPDMDYSATVRWIRAVLEPSGLWRAHAWAADRIAPEETADEAFDSGEVGQCEDDLAFHNGRGSVDLDLPDEGVAVRAATLEQLLEALAGNGVQVGEYGPLPLAPGEGEAAVLAAVTEVQEAIFGGDSTDVLDAPVEESVEAMRGRLQGVPEAILDRVAAWMRGLAAP